jgi:hypothetical protein
MLWLRDVLAMHFGVLQPSSATALIGGVIYTVMPTDDGGRPSGSALHHGAPPWRQRGRPP